MLLSISDLLYSEYKCLHTVWFRWWTYTHLNAEAPPASVWRDKWRSRTITIPAVLYGGTPFHLPRNLPGGVKESACLRVPLRYVVFDWFEFGKLSIPKVDGQRCRPSVRQTSFFIVARVKDVYYLSTLQSVPLAASSNSAISPDQHVLHGQIRTPKLYNGPIIQEAVNTFSPAATLNQLILTKERFELLQKFLPHGASSHF